jgi:hypothetical protein
MNRQHIYHQSTNRQIIYYQITKRQIIDDQITNRQITKSSNWKFVLSGGRDRQKPPSMYVLKGN